MSTKCIDGIANYVTTSACSAVGAGRFGGYPMKKNALLGGVIAFAITLGMGAGAAHAQTGTVNQAVPWQFKDANTTASQQNGLLIIQALRNHTLGETPAQSLSGNGGGVFGLGSTATNNYTVNQTVTNNNCSAAGAGADLNCGGGSIQATTTQTSTSSPVTAKSNATGNTVTAPTNSGNTNSTFGN